MSPLSSARRIVFPEKQRATLETFECPTPGPGEVLVQAHTTLMSTGTENIVFNRLFDPGTPWDRWVQYPFYPGYSSVGTVEAVGANVATLRVGDRVAYRQGHRSHAVESPENFFPIPQGVTWEQAAWFSLAKITAHGARAARYILGDSVLIIGAGPIGQMSIRWAQAAGASTILVVDTAAHRMPLAQQGGATATIVAPIDQAREKILQAGQGKLPRVVIDSTGNAAVFSAALGLAADRGLVVIMGDTGQPTHQTLTADVITRGLTIVGVHDTHNNAEWNNAIGAQLFFDLVATGRFSMEGLTSHTFAPDECAEAYAVANRDRATTMGILFDWTKTKKI
jgi:2-desacetyl-2-hydroxyethyl bacteriochlorophyllide A dehydrogenase